MMLDLIIEDKAPIKLFENFLEWLQIIAKYLA
jgi:hypothetical protein